MSISKPKDELKLAYSLSAILNTYLSGIITMNQLEDWIVINLQEAIDLKVVYLMTIFDSLDATIMEIGEDLATEKDLKDYASKALDTVKFALDS